MKDIMNNYIWVDDEHRYLTIYEAKNVAIKKIRHESGYDVPSLSIAADFLEEFCLNDDEKVTEFVEYFFGDVAEPFNENMKKREV